VCSGRLGVCGCGGCGGVGVVGCGSVGTGWCRGVRMSMVKCGCENDNGWV